MFHRGVLFFFVVIDCTHVRGAVFLPIRRCQVVRRFESSQFNCADEVFVHEYARALLALGRVTEADRAALVARLSESMGLRSAADKYSFGTAARSSSGYSNRSSGNSYDSGGSGSGGGSGYAGA